MVLHILRIASYFIDCFFIKINKLKLSIKNKSIKKIDYLRKSMVEKPPVGPSSKSSLGRYVGSATRGPSIDPPNALLFGGGVWLIYPGLLVDDRLRFSRGSLPAQIDMLYR